MNELAIFGGIFSFCLACVFILYVRWDERKRK